MDVILFTCDEQGYAEPGLAYLQFKATESLQTVASDYVFDLDIRDYNLWIMEEMPVILILFDATRRRAFWLHIQGYFRREEDTRQPRRGTKTVRVRVPMRQAVNRRALSSIRTLKDAARYDARADE